jgi:magnesium transporter
MVRAYLFDQRHGKKVEAWAESFRDLSKHEVIWLDMANPSEDEECQVREALGLADAGGSSLADPEGKPGLEQQEGYLRVTAVAVSDKESDADHERVVVQCFVGPNWVLTAHNAEVGVLEDFREIASGEGELGVLDAPSFLSALMEWVVTSYLRAFEAIEETLEEFDVNALASPSKNPEERIEMLIDARRRVGRLRRALAPHREVFAALSHSEFDPISSEKSAERFAELTASVDIALAAARDAKEGIASSFDVLIVRTEHRTNEIVKVLTLASILLLPGSLIAGVAGMNVNLALHVFVQSALFWGVVAGIILVALGTLGVARIRRWI